MISKKYRHLIGFCFGVVTTLTLSRIMPLYSHSKDVLKRPFPSIPNQMKKNQHLETGKDCLNLKIEILESPSKFFDYLISSTINSKCKNLELMGRGNKNTDAYNDGSKRVCIDEEYKILNGKCNILSFGINDNWSFDDYMGRIGCKVYSFDPTIGKGDYIRSENVTFYKLGISDKEGYLRNNTAMKVDRYKNILIKINLLDAEIDYLKMDVEGYEIKFFNDVLNDKESDLLLKVKQIGMEIHIGRFTKLTTEELAHSNSTMNKLWNIFQKLECRGFTLVSTEMNSNGRNPYLYGTRRVSASYEIVFIRKIRF